MFASTCNTGALRVEGMSPYVESLGWSSSRRKLARTNEFRPIAEVGYCWLRVVLWFGDGVEIVTKIVAGAVRVRKRAQGSKVKSSTVIHFVFVTRCAEAGSCGRVVVERLDR